MAGFAEHLARTSLRLKGYTSRYVPTSAGRVHVLEVEGQGTLPPLVLLHGLSSAGVHFFPLLSHLQQSHSRIVIPDLPGHGFSDTPRRLDAESMRHGLYEAMDVLTDAQPAMVFGNSLGGYAAIRYALARPHRVRALLLASPGGGEMTDDELEQLRNAFRLTRHREALAFIDRLLARRSRIRHLYAWGLRRQLRRPEVEAVLRAATSAELLTAEEINQLSQPLLLIWGRHERILPSRHLEFFRQHLPEHAEIHDADDWGHSPFLDDAPAFARRLVQFAFSVTRASS